MGAAYEPGEGLSRAVAGGRARLADHVSAASALLTAYECTGRLPYSMLAEELMQFVARTLGDAGAAGFADGETASKPFALNCDAASVLYRLDALHRSAEYREAAVVAPAADYGRDAERILRWLAPQMPETGLAGAVFGLAAAGGFAPRFEIGNPAIYNRNPMSLDRASLIPALKNIATRLRIDSVRVDVGGRQRPSDELLLGGRHHGGAVLRRDALRSEGSAAIPRAIASCCRRGTPRRFSTRRGPKPARSIAPSC